MLAAHPGQHAAIVAYWKAVFPNDEWVVPLQRAIQANEGKKVARSAATPRPNVSISPPLPARRDAPGVIPKDTGAGGMGFELPPPGSQPESPPGIGPGDEPGIMR